MDGLQIALPIVGVVAAAAVTFYAVSFSELREVLTLLLSPFPYQPHFKFFVLISLAMLIGTEII